MDKITRFLWFCAGVYRPLLKRSPTDGNKFAGVGATVLFTAIFAGLAAGYALHMVFANVYVTVPLAILWSLAIFNLDRYIVGTMRKSGSKWKEFGVAAPRLILAIVLAIVIVKPLELRIFEREINQQLATKQLQLVSDTKSSLEANYPELQEIDLQIELLRQETAAKRAFRDEKQREYDDERFGVKTPGTTGRMGIGINARKKEEQLDQAQLDYQTTEQANREKISYWEAERQRISQQKEAEANRQQSLILSMDGIAARLQALDDLGSENSAIWTANLFIILLFILLETAPILVKWIAERGPYDVLLEYREQEVIMHAEDRWHRTSSDYAYKKTLFDHDLAIKKTISLHKASVDS